MRSVLASFFNFSMRINWPCLCNEFSIIFPNYDKISSDVEGLLHIGHFCASFQSPFYNEANLQNPFL